MKPNKKPNKALMTAIYIILFIAFCAIIIGAFVGIEYGRYLFLAPDDMDFSTFYWIDTMKR